MRALSATRILAIAKKEFFHLRRDRLTAGMVVGIPLLMTLLFGYGINHDVRDLRAVVVDEANTSASRALVAGLAASQVIRIVGRAGSPSGLEEMIASARISVGIHIPPDFEERVAHRDPPFVQILADDSDPVVLSAVRGLNGLVIAPDRNGPLVGSSAQPASAVAIRPLYNPERRTAVFIVPGLCGVILTLTMVLFTSIAVVRERERGNLELLITTPVGVLELMTGKLIPYIFIGYLQITLILFLGVVLFDVPVRGELFDFYAGAGAFVISILTLGLLISTTAETQFQAFQMTFMSFLPQMLLSGFMFPFEGMPRVIQYLGEVFPLTHILRIVRGVVLRDATLPMLTADIWPLALFFVVVLTFATLRFRKRLD